MVQREPCYAKPIRKGWVSQHESSGCQCGDIGNHPTSNGEYRRPKVHVSSVQLSLQSINHHHPKRLLRRISEEFDLETTAEEMTFVEHNDFQQGSASNEPQQRYGSGLGDASFVEDDDDYEFLLDEGLARDGLYRGMPL